MSTYREQHAEDGGTEVLPGPFRVDSNLRVFSDRVHLGSLAHKLEVPRFS